MRIIRTVLLIILAIVLVALAFANRQAVTLSLSLTDYLQLASVTLPLFLVIFITLMIGTALGLIWEWLRAAGQRAESAQRAHQISRLEREVSSLRKQHRAPADGVEAILDAPTDRTVTTGTALAASPATQS